MMSLAHGVKPDDRLPAMPCEPPSTWRDIAAQWLKNPAAQALEVEARARRPAALRRWRGLQPETLPRVY